jgi:hypothetical protein
MTKRFYFHTDDDSYEPNPRIQSFRRMTSSHLTLFGSGVAPTP